MCANYRWCYFRCLFESKKSGEIHALLSNSAWFQMHWIYWRKLYAKNVWFHGHPKFTLFPRQNLETFEWHITHAFPPLTVAKLPTLRISPVLSGPPCIKRQTVNGEFPPPLPLSQDACAPSRRLSPSVGRWSSPTAVQLQWHAEAACAANT